MVESENQLTQRRRHSNGVKRRLPGQAWREGNTAPISGVTAEFSEEGLFFETQYPFSSDSKVMLELAFSGRTIRLDGVVADVNTADGHLRALQVEGMGVKVAYSKEQLKSLVSAPLPKRRIEIDSAAVVYFGSDRRQLKLQNLSASGVALISDSNLPENSFFRMIFRLKESSSPIDISGIPVRSEVTENGTLIGMRFLDPPDRVIDEIEEFIRAQTEDSSDASDQE